MLADRLNVADIENAIITPLHGDDFNDDLVKGATAADYAPPSATPIPTLPQTEPELTAAALALTFPPDIPALGRLLGALALARPDQLVRRQVLNAVKATTRMPITVLEKQLRDLERRYNGAAAPIIRPDWTSRLRLSDDGKPERNEANAITALSGDEIFAGTLILNEMRQEIMALRSLPWDTGDVGPPRPWTTNDDICCAEWMQRRDINVTPLVVSRAVGAVANKIRIHPLRDYLNHLRWDGVSRLETWVTDYLGVADTPLSRAVGSRWMISAVARVLRPGCKADHMMILEGPQGAKKSTALKVLAGDDWFTDELAEIGSKDAAQQMRGIWIIEIAELDAFSRAEVSRIKSFLTRTVDRYRPPYERYVIDAPRQCVFAGSVNPDTYLRDETGNRRFWPLRCGRIDIDAISRDRDQLWAEAVARFHDGAIWWLDDPDLIAAANAEQEARYQGDAWDARIDHWLAFDRRRVNRGYGGYDDWRDEDFERDPPISDVSGGEILEKALGIEPARWTRGDQMRVSAYLKARKWERYKAWGPGAREWRYRRPGWVAE